MPPLSSYVHLQCERIHDGLFVEPLNLITGFFFIIVSWLLYREYKKGKPRRSVLILIILTALIGVGSMTFHATARMWAALLADIPPIAIWAVVYLFMFSKHILKLNIAGSTMFLFMFVVINMAFKVMMFKAMDGYFSVLPSVIFLVGISLYMWADKNPSFSSFAVATALACVGLFFRIIDKPICAELPIGTHFLWHAFMAGFMYLNVKEIMRRSRI